MLQYKPKSLFAKLALIIPLITIGFWILLSVLSAHYLRNTLKTEFANSNAKIMRSIALQSINDLSFSDFYQLRRTLHDFYDDSYMDYFALYTSDMKPFATYPATQFASSDLQFIEKQVEDNSRMETVQKFFDAFNHRRFHFQQQVKDENGKVLGYLFMGGRTEWLDKTVSRQILYFIILGFFVLAIEMGVLVYFARRFTKPITQLTNTLKIANERTPEELIPAVLAQPKLVSTCSEVDLFDSVVRKLLETIQKYQNKEMELSVQATLGRLTSHFAHDIRTPISSIGNYITLRAPDESKDKDEHQKFLNIKKQVKKIDQMADELTSYTKAKEIKLSAVPITEILNDVKEGLEDIPMRPENLKLNIEAKDDLFAEVDHDKLSRVISNVTLNAIQAIGHKEGLVNIKAEDIEKNLVILIKDNGCGIKPEHLPRLFESSFTYGKIKGTGLGLAYCKNVIEAHGGFICAESELGKGATFRIVIPNCIRKGIPNKAKNIQAPDADISKLKQWIVADDTEEFRNQWKDILAKHDFPPPIEITRPEELATAVQNISFAEIRGAIIDYTFENSKGNGFDIVEYLRMKGIKCIYLCTGNYKEEKVLKEAGKWKIDTIIPKPIPEDVSKRLQLS